MNLIENSSGADNRHYEDINTIFEKFMESEQEEVDEEFKNRLDNLEVEERYEAALFIYFKEFNEENSEEVERLEDDISLIPEWEFLEKYSDLLESLEFMFAGLLNQARIELPREIGSEEFVSDKLLEELLLSLQGFKKGISEDDADLIVDSGNVAFNLIYSLMKYKNGEFDLEEVCVDVLKSSEKLKALGLENEISQRMLSEFYNVSDPDIDEFKERLRLERSLVIYKDQRIDLSVSRAAEMAGYSHREFLEEAKNYDVILKEG